MPSNTRFAIAVHILSVLGYLEKQGVTLVSSSQIARSVNANAVVVRTMLRALKKAKLILSKEGKGGGISLAKKPSLISLQEIHNAVEGKSVFTVRKKPSFKACPVSCGMKSAFSEVANEVDHAISKVLHGKTLKDFIEKLAG